MSKTGTITFKQVDKDSHFVYKYEISNYDAAKILEYISKVPHKAKRYRVKTDAQS